MKNSTATIITIVVMVVIVAVSSYIYDEYYVKPKIEDIKQNMAFTDGLITYVRFEDYKGPRQTYIEYEYVANGKKLSIKSSLEENDPDKLTRNDLLFKHFTVIFSSKHNDVSDILVTKEDSLRYGLRSQ